MLKIQLSDDVDGPSGRLLMAGRSPSNNLRIDHPTVSWLHAEMWVREQSAWLKDLGSTNGTWLNGVKVTGRVEVNDGDRVRLGESDEITVRLLDVSRLSHGPMALRSPTDTPSADLFDYEVRAEMDGPVGPRACVRRYNAVEHSLMVQGLSAELLYMLAERLEEDRAGPIAPSEAGWCRDQDLMLGLWGRAGLVGGRTRLGVTVHRLRKRMQDLGLNEKILQKSNGRTRLVVVSATTKRRCFEIQPG